MLSTFSAKIRIKSEKLIPFAIFSQSWNNNDRQMKQLIGSMAPR